MRVKILTGYDGICSYRDLAVANFTEYCQRWGYELVAKFDNWGPPVAVHQRSNVGPAAAFWRRWQLIAEELHDCDWLLWLDPDCVIMNMTLPITEIVNDTIDMAITGPFHPCPKCGAPVYSSGILFLRCCDWSKDMVRDLLAAASESWQKGPTINCIALSGNNWFCCKFLPADMNMLHVKTIVPEKMGYCRVVTPGQFLIHLYSGSDAGRTKSMTTYQKSIIR